MRILLGSGVRSTCRPHGWHAAAWPPRSGQAELLPVRFLPGGTSEISGDNVGRVPVQAAAGTVIPHGGAGIGVRGGFLDVTERNPGVEGGGDERVPQGVPAP